MRGERAGEQHDDAGTAPGGTAARSSAPAASSAPRAPRPTAARRRRSAARSSSRATGRRAPARTGCRRTRARVEVRRREQQPPRRRASASRSAAGSSVSSVGAKALPMFAPIASSDHRHHEQGQPAPAGDRLRSAGSTAPSLTGCSGSTRSWSVAGSWGPPPRGRWPGAGGPSWCSSSSSPGTPGAARTAVPASSGCAYPDPFWIDLGPRRAGRLAASSRPRPSADAPGPDRHRSTTAIRPRSTRSGRR